MNPEENDLTCNIDEFEQRIIEIWKQAHSLFHEKSDFSKAVNAFEELIAEYQQVLMSQNSSLDLRLKFLPELSTAKISLAHSLILSLNWDQISDCMPTTEMNYLEASGWLNSLRKKRPVDRELKYIPWYTYPAIEFIENKIAKNFRVFEYGSGNSTLWWSTQVAEVVSIESDEKWFTYLQQEVPSNVKLIFIEEEKEYPATITQYPDHYFDIIVIDGISRNECCQYSIPKIRKNGFIIFDNTDNYNYDYGVNLLNLQGFKRIDFYGLIPSYLYKNCTSVFFYDDNFLLNRQLPSDKQSILGKSCLQISHPKPRLPDNIESYYGRHHNSTNNEPIIVDPHILCGKQLNLIVLIDWNQDEEKIYEQLFTVISAVLNHPQCTEILLVINSRTVVDQESADLFLATILMDLLMVNDQNEAKNQEEIPEIMLTGKLNNQEWNYLVNLIDYRLVLPGENTENIENQVLLIPGLSLEQLQQIKIQKLLGT